MRDARHLPDFGFGSNDLQPVAVGLCPELGEALDWLASQGLQGRMTGSGSAVFAHAPPGTAVALQPGGMAGWQVRKCSNLEAHPLAGW